MIYPEYEEILNKYQRLVDRFSCLLTKKEDLFTRTLPSGIRYDKDHVQSSPTSTMLDEYVISLDESQIDEELAKTKELISNTVVLLEIKKRQLKSSRDIPDRVYCLKYLDGIGITEMCDVMGYSRSQIYRVLTQISKKCKKMRQNETK